VTPTAPGERLRPEEVTSGTGAQRWHVEAAVERLDDIIASLQTTGDNPTGLIEVVGLLRDGLAGKPAGMTAKGYAPPFYGTFIGEVRLRPEEVTRLRELAERATPGPWDWDVIEDVPEISIPRDVPRRSSSIWSARPAEDASFIAAANPSAVLALLDRLDAMPLDVERLRMAMDAVFDEVGAGLRGLTKVCAHDAYWPLGDPGGDQVSPGDLADAIADAYAAASAERRPSGSVSRSEGAPK
jgi:hypothetical protein